MPRFLIHWWVFFLRPLPPYPSQESPFQHPPPLRGVCGTVYPSMRNMNMKWFVLTIQLNIGCYYLPSWTKSISNFLFIIWEIFYQHFLAISWKYTNSISGLNTLFWFQLFCSKLFSCFLYLVKRQFNFFYPCIERFFLTLERLLKMLNHNFELWNILDIWICKNFAILSFFHNYLDHSGGGGQLDVCKFLGG